MSRGIKNHNPGSIRLSSIKWEGEVAGKDKSFCTFESPEYGIRAIGVILINYQRKYNLDSISKMIHRYAPPNENNTEEYIDFVCKRVNVLPDEWVDVRTILSVMIKAIIKMENGEQPYGDEVIDRGCQLALDLFE